MRFMWKTTYLLNTTVQESHVLATAGVALGLQVNALELKVLDALLQRSLLLVQLHALLALRRDVFLNLLSQAFGATHLADGGRGDVFLVRKLGLEVEDLPIRQRCITLGRRPAPGQIFQACGGFCKSCLKTLLLCDEHVALCRNVVHIAAQVTNLPKKIDDLALGIVVRVDGVVSRV